ncbi:cyclin-dependent kinase 11A-like [Diachasma alloeum]|uniref:cyclin-dependent kinase 11A-like n=1 Tax=Diachasma alloeum TaxID=454923 RepID=UPI0007384393|nr:cyclin-dependent kinase 11A-like [Diachasma alloeum]
MEGNRSRDGTPTGREEIRLDRLEKWMEKWERKQKEEWEEKMADLEYLIRKEVGKVKIRCENCERRRGESEEDQLTDQLRDTQERLRVSEDQVEELESKVRQWKGVAETWKIRAEEAREELKKTKDATEDGRDVPISPANTVRTVSPSGSLSGRRGDPSTWSESDRRVGGPGGQRAQIGQGHRTMEERRNETKRLKVREDERNQEGEGDGKERVERDRVELKERGAEEEEVGFNNPPPRKLTQEEREEELEMRRLRRKNMIIEGLTLITRTRKEELEHWLWETLGVRARVEKLDRREEGGLTVRMEERASKIEVMKEKTKLKELGWGVYISDDLTDRQKEVQAWLEREAENWRKTKKQAGTKYNCICVDGIWLEWDEVEGEMRQKVARERTERRGPF